MEQYQTFFRVQHHECGPDRAMRLSPIFDRLQNAAAEHADRLGCGLTAMLDNASLWVLSRLKLRFFRRPQLGEDVELLTYPSGEDKLFARREYRMRVGAETLISGSSAWLVLDRSSLRPQRPGHKFSFPENADLPVEYPVLDKIPAVPEVTESRHYRVSASQIDLNGHLNNAFYAAFVQDALGTADLAELQLNFLQSCPLDSRIVTSTGSAENAVYVCGKLAEDMAADGKLCFQALARLK